MNHLAESRRDSSRPVRQAQGRPERQSNGRAKSRGYTLSPAARRARRLNALRPKAKLYGFLDRNDPDRQKIQQRLSGEEARLRKEYREALKRIRAHRPVSILDGIGPFRPLNPAKAGLTLSHAEGRRAYVDWWIRFNEASRCPSPQRPPEAA